MPVTSACATGKLKTRAAHAPVLTTQLCTSPCKLLQDDNTTNSTYVQLLTNVCTTARISTIAAAQVLLAKTVQGKFGLGKRPSDGVI
eukprot:105356-Amphidinium_carterae.1